MVPCGDAPEPSLMLSVYLKTVLHECMLNIEHPHSDTLTRRQASVRPAEHQL